MTNVYVYNVVAIATGVLLNRRMRVVNYYNHVTCLTEEKAKQ